MAGQQERFLFETVYLEATQRLPSPRFVKGCRRKTLIIDRGSTITSPFKTDTLDYESSRKIKVESIRRTEYGTHEFKYRNCWQKIRQIREAIGLSRPKFADLLGVPNHPEEL